MGSATEAILAEYEEKMDLSVECLKGIAQCMADAMDRGLEEEEDGNGLLMIPTMIDTLPDGHEKGEFFGIDFGGSNLRVLYTKLAGGRHEVEKVEFEDFEVPNEWKSADVTAEQLFDKLATCLIKFVEREGWGLKHVHCPTIGFCFNFPVEATSINSGTLIKWVKGFANPGAVGHDPAKLLTDAFKRQGHDVVIAALMNDTVGAMAAARYSDGPDARIAVVNGTGTNACYIELLSHIGKFRPHQRPRTSDMVVNLELAGCSTHVPHVPRIPQDEELDEASVHRGQQLFEKMTAGLYLGDLARRIICRLADEGGWWDRTPVMDSKRALSTKQVVRMGNDSSADHYVIAEELKDSFGIPRSSTSADVRAQVQRVCKAVLRRSARLEAAAIAGIISHLRSEGTAPGSTPNMNIVAVEGWVFRSNASYLGHVSRGIRDILGPDDADNFALRATEGGAAFGAACVAAAAHAYQAVMGSVSDVRQPSFRFPRRSATSTQLPQRVSRSSGSGTTSPGEPSPRTSFDAQDAARSLVWPEQRKSMSPVRETEGTPADASAGGGGADGRVDTPSAYYGFTHSQRRSSDEEADPPAGPGGAKL